MADTAAISALRKWLQGLPHFLVPNRNDFFVAGYNAGVKAASKSEQHKNDSQGRDE